VVTGVLVGPGVDVAAVTVLVGLVATGVPEVVGVAVVVSVTDPVGVTVVDPVGELVVVGVLAGTVAVGVAVSVAPTVGLGVAVSVAPTVGLGVAVTLAEVGVEVAVATAVLVAVTVVGTMVGVPPRLTVPGPLIWLMKEPVSSSTNVVVTSTYGVAAVRLQVSWARKLLVSSFTAIRFVSGLLGSNVGLYSRRTLSSSTNVLARLVRI
jgi:hypothetical protein